MWRGRIDGNRVAVRHARRSAASLDWELDLQARLDMAVFRPPQIVPTADGARRVGQVVVTEWVEGHQPRTADERGAVAAGLRALHSEWADHPQRPGCVTVRELTWARRSVDADLDRMPPDVASLVEAVFGEADGLPTSVIHGDPSPSNTRLQPDGSVVLLDWDESRVDVPLLDRAGVQDPLLEGEELTRALRVMLAWEVANGWLVEPSYARARLKELRQLLRRRA
nr:phosphotransferase [Euzebya tangerina]